MPRTQPRIRKDIAIVRRFTSPHTGRGSTLRRIEALHASPANSQHLVDGLNPLEVSARRLPTVVVDIPILEVQRDELLVLLLPPTTSFYLGPIS